MVFDVEKFANVSWFIIQNIMFQDRFFKYGISCYKEIHCIVLNKLKLLNITIILIYVL